MQVHTVNKAVNGKYKSCHLTRPLSITEIKKMHCKKISCSNSTNTRLSKKVKTYLTENKIEIKLEKHKGKPIQMSPKEILKVIKMYRIGKSYRQIEKETSIPKSTVHYLIKKAKRTKVKRGKTVLSI